MWLIDKLAEERILEAQRKGAFDDLPGQGKPLSLEDDALVPQELRVAYRVLKNAGFVPPEVALRKEIHEVEELLAGLDESEARDAGLRRLRCLMSRLNTSASANLRTEQDYYDKLLRRFGEPARDLKG